MFCIEWDADEPIKIGGEWESDTYTNLDIVLTPCNYLHTLSDNYEDSVSSECILDLES